MHFYYSPPPQRKWKFSVRTIFPWFWLYYEVHYDLNNKRVLLVSKPCVVVFIKFSSLQDMNSPPCVIVRPSVFLSTWQHVFIMAHDQSRSYGLLFMLATSSGLSPSVQNWDAPVYCDLRESVTYARLRNLRTRSWSISCCLSRRSSTWRLVFRYERRRVLTYGSLI